jgi:hypothetical protein
MPINADVFDAYLKCPTKCFLRAYGEAGAGNVYADWVRTETEGYRQAGIKRLTEGAAPDECVTGLTGTKDLKTAKWRIAAESEIIARTGEGRRTLPRRGSFTYRESENVLRTHHTIFSLPPESHHTRCLILRSARMGVGRHGSPMLAGRLTVHHAAPRIRRPPSVVCGVRSTAPVFAPESSTKG